MEFEEGSWYWASDAHKWKIKVVLSNLVLARRKYHPFAEAFIFTDDGKIVLHYFVYTITIDPKWKVKLTRVKAPKVES